MPPSFKCPECEKEMRWAGDENADETIYGVYICQPCDIEMMKFYNRSEQ